MEALLDTKMVYIGCNHHVLEILLNASWLTLFGPTKSKDNSECKEFKEHWSDIDVSKEIAVLPLFKNQQLDDLKVASIGIISSILKEGDRLPRDDYRESGELALVMLGENPKRWDKPRWCKPGAFHHARWMHLLLYAPKMYAFHNQ